jgi:hypothetical protein
MWLAAGQQKGNRGGDDVETSDAETRDVEA